MLCRRCNNNYPRCYCSNLEYDQQWWKWGPDQWPHGSTVYCEGQKRSFRVVNDPGPADGAKVEVRADPRGYNYNPQEPNQTILRADLSLSKIPDHYSGRVMGKLQE